MEYSLESQTGQLGGGGEYASCYTSPSVEIRVTNEKTGGEKGQKLARFDLIPSDSLWALAEHFGKGAQKYESRNWEKGIDFSLYFAAAQRHMWQWWEGEDIDEETGTSHLISAAWHVFALFHNMGTHPECDDRVTLTKPQNHAKVAVAREATEDGIY